MRPPTSALLARMASRSFCKRDAERAQPVRIDDDIILLDEAADAGDLRDAFGLGETVAQRPVLERAQFGERHLLGDERILVDPADAGRVRPERGRHAPPAASCLRRSDIRGRASAPNRDRSPSSKMT